MVEEMELVELLELILLVVVRVVLEQQVQGQGVHQQSVVML